MKPVYQTRFGTEGNCWPACLASLFEVSLESVDHCAGHYPDWLKNTRSWLTSRGLCMVELFITDEHPPKYTAPPDGSIFIVGCFTERCLPHCVIGRFHWTRTKPDGECESMEMRIVHDPMPGGSREYRVDAIFFFYPINPQNYGN